LLVGILRLRDPFEKKPLPEFCGNLRWVQADFAGPADRFISKTTQSRCLFLWAGERQERAFKAEIAILPVATLLPGCVVVEFPVVEHEIIEQGDQLLHGFVQVPPIGFLPVVVAFIFFVKQAMGSNNSAASSRSFFSRRCLHRATNSCSCSRSSLGEHGSNEMLEALGVKGSCKRGGQRAGRPVMLSFFFDATFCESAQDVTFFIMDAEHVTPPLDQEVFPQGFPDDCLSPLQSSKIAAPPDRTGHFQ
jgi:hypothetical protein